jgi:leucyl-tRNA synthetase
MAEDTPKFRYDANLAAQLEARWQERWDALQAFRQPNPGDPDFDPKRPKFYCLDMFPYPSGSGLHVGHPEGYTATDILSRYKRMRGFNVLHPMGWDAFGLPAEQYALQTNIHPAITTKQAMDTFRRQLKRFGFSYDWSREISTIDPAYYKQTQWIFLQIYGAFFDTTLQRARPIAELIAEFASGQRAVAFNPDAGEISGSDKQRSFGPWAKLDAATQRSIVNSYRLAYLAEQTVNWCPKLGTALANEEVIDGRSERGGHPVFRKPLEQWLMRFTSFSKRLLDGLAQLDWPSATIAKQTAWIGYSVGAELEFKVVTPDAPADRPALRVFTTRPDTLFGATYLVLAPEHPLVEVALRTPSAAAQSGALRAYAEQAKNRSDLERQQNKDKTGVFSGLHAQNPASGESVPIWVSDYVLMGYGTGAIMAVPAHDERDHEFAQRFELPIRSVVVPSDDSKVSGCFSGEGKAINSANAEVSLNGLPTAQAKQTIIAWLEQRAIGKTKTNTKLRDWLFSRQRYWGEPFPIVYDKDHNHYPLAPSRLPLVLPELEDFKPEESQDPKPLLAKAKEWVQTTAGEAGVSELPPETPMTRETNTMPNWAGSCWYYLRFADPTNPDAPIGKEADRYWLSDGVDLYVGGSEHAVLHLLYARFWHQLLHDLGHASSPEPFRKLFHQGLILSFAYQRADKSLVAVDQVEERGEGNFVETATGEKVAQITAKMSKSLRNITSPDDVFAAYGADTFRLYEMYMGPLDASKPWNTRDISGLARFLQRTWRVLVNEESGELTLAAAANAEVEKLLHRTIAKVQADIERLAFNTAIAAMIGFVNTATSEGGLTKDQADRFIRVLGPFAPHMAEELWNKLGHTKLVSLAEWPSYDEAQLQDDQVEVPVQIMGKVRHRLMLPASADAKAMEALALADAKVKELLAGKTVKKIVVVPGKLINIVAS